MPKETSKAAPKSGFIGVRVTAEMRRAIEQISRAERRTMSQVCEFLISLGLERYNKTGFDFIEKGKT